MKIRKTIISNSMIEKFIEKYGKEKLDKIITILLDDYNCDDPQCDDEGCVLNKAFLKYLKYFP